MLLCCMCQSTASILVKCTIISSTDAFCSWVDGSTKQSKSLPAAPRICSVFKWTFIKAPVHPHPEHDYTFALRVLTKQVFVSLGAVLTRLYSELYILFL